jgi:RimJ/RimL family protein N-acetyltransferase
MAVSLRPVAPEDLATIARWAVAVGSDSYMSRTRPTAAGADRHDPASGLFWYLVVEDARDMGTVWIERLPAEPEARLGVFLGSTEDFGRGVGRAALRLAIREFRKAFPAEAISLHVRRSNERAIRCYRSVGFAIVDTGTKRSRSGALVTFYRMTCSRDPCREKSRDKASSRTCRGAPQDRGVSP